MPGLSRSLVACAALNARPSDVLEPNLGYTSEMFHDATQISDANILFSDLGINSVHFSIE
jgi:hypothetical protein